MKPHYIISTSIGTRVDGGSRLWLHPNEKVGCLWANGQAKRVPHTKFTGQVRSRNTDVVEHKGTYSGSQAKLLMIAGSKCSCVRFWIDAGLIQSATRSNSPVLFSSMNRECTFSGTDDAALRAARYPDDPHETLFEAGAVVEVRHGE